MPHSIVQAYVPRLAFDALDIPLIVKLARLAGVDQPRIESSTYRIPRSAPAGSMTITCSLEMALALVEAFKQPARRAEDKGESTLLVESANAVARLLAAIADVYAPGRSTGTEPTPY